MSSASWRLRRCCRCSRFARAANRALLRRRRPRALEPDQLEKPDTLEDEEERCDDDRRRPGWRRLLAPPVTADDDAPRRWFLNKRRAGTVATRLLALR